MHFRGLLCCLICFFVLPAIGGRVHAYQPSDPAIVAMVDRGVRFLEKQERMTEGETVLIAFAHLKAQHDESNQVVMRGIRQATKFAENAGRVGKDRRYKSHYEHALSVMLLCEIDPRRFRNELEAFLAYFNESQLRHGGYGYPGEGVGDVSQTQYAVLALWTLGKHGFEIDYQRLIRTMEWLFRVQDLEGGWPYHGKIIQGREERFPQSRISTSMSIAGGSTLLIAADALQMWGSHGVDSETRVIGLPKAVRIFAPNAQDARLAEVRPPRHSRIWQAIREMENWRDKTRTGPSDELPKAMYWNFYKYYSYERYYTFLELIGDSSRVKIPDWYDTTVERLARLQNISGGWEVKAHTNPGVSTAFAILFLVRSTKQSLTGSGGAGTAIGGRDFLPDVSNTILRAGKIYRKRETNELSGIILQLESDDADSFDGKVVSNAVKLSPDSAERTIQIERLDKLVRGSRSWQARRFAARLLASSDDMEAVPGLIFALSDPDHKVRTNAREGLRMISRNFEGYGLSDEPTVYETVRIQRNWRDWYRRVRPGYEFVDD